MISPKANAAREKLEDGLPTAGLIVIDFDAERWGDVKPGSGQLERFVTPDDLR
jgi:phosphohistidine phosphatase